MSANLRAMFGLVLAMLGGPTAARAEVRYAPPTPGRLMLNELLVTERPAQYTLYLDKPGRFYAEVMFEGASCAIDGPAIRFSVTRGTKRQWQREVTLRLDEARPHQTLFWFRAPDDMPYRTALELSLTPVAETASACPLRLQITRKFEVRPVVPR